MAAVIPRSTLRPAAFSPGGPAPITITSNSSVMRSSLPRKSELPEDQIGDEPGPPRLVRGAQALAAVAVEVLVERQHVVPGRVRLELGRLAVHRTPALVVVQEQ